MIILVLIAILIVGVIIFSIAKSRSNQQAHAQAIAAREKQLADEKKRREDEKKKREDEELRFLKPHERNLPLHELVKPYIERLEKDVELAERGETVIQSEEKAFQNDKILDYIHEYHGTNWERYPSNILLLKPSIIDTDDRYLKERKSIRQGEETLRRGEETLRRGEETLRRGEETLRRGEEWIKASEECLVAVHREVFTPDEMAEIARLRKNDDLEGYIRLSNIGRQREDGYAVIKLSAQKFETENGLSPEEALEMARQIYANDPERASRVAEYKNL